MFVYKTAFKMSRISLTNFWYQYGLQYTQQHKQYRPTLRQCFFYRTMPFSAKHVVYPSVRL